MISQTEVESTRTELEKIMMGLPQEKSQTERRMYLAGHIDCLALKGFISEDTRETLYAEYCF